MKKWQNYAAPDDPDSWYDVDGVWPTPRGSYETADFLTGITATATSTGDVIYAWAAKTTKTSGANPHYVVDDGGKIWQYDAASGPINDRTGAASFSTLPRIQFAQYGSITIGVLGSPRNAYPSAAWPGAATIYTTGVTVNFAALVGAPQGDCICVARNAVAILNTDTATDGYGISDVGDYTNWTTGEAVSGRIFEPAGPIMAAVSFADDIIAFKRNSIHRLRYTGNVVKWTQEKLWQGVGCATTNRACAGATGILFAGTSASDTGNPTVPFYWFDGANQPVLTNPLTEIAGTGPIVYNPIKNIFSVWNGNTVYYFDPMSRAWGKNTTPFGSTPPTCKPIEGSDALFANTTTKSWGKSAANTLKFFTSSSNVGSGYLQTMMVGTFGGKTRLGHVVPKLRRLVDAGAQALTLTVDFFRELHDSVAASSQSSIAVNTSRVFFDFQGVDSHARLKLNFTDYDLEIDDLAAFDVKPAGKF